MTFLEEQRRHRRATWRLSLLFGFATAVMGMAVSTVLSPLVALLALLGMRLANLFVQVPSSVWEAFRWFVALFDHLAWAIQHRRISLEELVPILMGVGVLLLPGMLAIMLLWLVLRTLFLRAGVGGILLGLSAREPRHDDLEEQQLVNVVSEMAIAAGISPPRVTLLDADVANAAAIGSSPDDATLIVSRRLLDEFNRDETQGALAHLIGWTANGDLRITLVLLSVVQTFGLLMTMLDLPLSARARRGLPRLLSFIVGWRRRASHAVEAELVRAILTRSLEPESIEDVTGVVEDTDRPSIGWFHRMFLYLRMFLLLPFLLASLLAKLFLFIFTLLALGPMIWVTLRTRRYLADATAVQLTRNPDGLASALIALSESGGVLPGSQWSSHLFIMGAKVGKPGAKARLLPEFKRIRWRPRGGLRSRRNVASMGEVGSAAREGGSATAANDNMPSLAEEPLILIGAHPPLSSRLKRLQALGAAIRAVECPSPPVDHRRATSSSWDVLTWTLWVLIAGPILILLASFFLYLLAVAVLAAALLVGGLVVIVMRHLPHLLPP